MTPTDQELNIAKNEAVAKACGWVKGYWHDSCFEYEWKDPNRKGWNNCPDYGADLNASAEMEKSVKDWNAYAKELEWIVRRDGVIEPNISPSILIDVLLIRATASQRRKGFLLHLNLYQSTTEAK